MNVFPMILIAVGCAASAHAQVVLVHEPGGRPVSRLNFVDPPVSTGPTTPFHPAFESVGISSVRRLGEWFTPAGTINQGFSGRALASNGNELWVQAPFGPIDGMRSDAGYRVSFGQPIASFGFIFVQQTSHLVNIELLSGAQSLGSEGYRIDGTIGAGSFPNPPLGWRDAQGRLFDAIHVTNETTTFGWAFDDIWVETPAPSALSVLGLGGLIALRPRR